MNNWGIPDWLEQEVRERDKRCVYCKVEMTERTRPGESRRNVATWEHIVNDARIVTRENIARCCNACNASKGAKPLADWLESEYCRQKGISADSVANVVRLALRK
jgi:hypothetical protein